MTNSLSHALTDALAEHGETLTDEQRQTVAAAATTAEAIDDGDDPVSLDVASASRYFTGDVISPDVAEARRYFD